MDNAFIAVRHLYKVFHMGEEKVYALRDVNLDIARGEMVCLLGPSGSGKSTLLNALAGLEKPTKGEIVIGGVHLEQLSESQVTLFRSLNVGFVFQSYNLIPTLDAMENVTLGMMLKGVPKKEYEEAAKRVLTLVGLGERLHHRPTQLSGGQQQRVSIARALAKKPKLLLCDEPTGALDYETGKSILKLLQDTCRRDGMTVVIITHNAALAAMADRIIRVKSGHIYSVRMNEHITPVEQIEW